MFLEKVSVPKKQWTLFTELFSLSLAFFFSFLNLVGKLAHWTHFLFFILLYTFELPTYKKCQYQRNSELGLFNFFRFHFLFLFQIWLVNWPIEHAFYFLLFYIHISYYKKKNVNTTNWYNNLIIVEVLIPQNIILEPITAKNIGIVKKKKKMQHL